MEHILSMFVKDCFLNTPCTFEDQTSCLTGMYTQAIMERERGGGEREQCFMCMRAGEVRISGDRADS